ncbi:hypothetical protein C7974DRAFT_206923 [Boeremia exigua]|uniref:uncharacterized protein n=1 Tax=Boeremia exigua TaxID=749465 RepID=UPI001E8DA7DE|nr:uncharacterized protein C7974DRAFT_206923 [Boeremia exigua]KAH6625759.1 hypothetical protein C7974DRAFT_206923 [Boeremia exigua]
MTHILRSFNVFRKSHDYAPLSPLPPIARPRIGVKIAIAICIIITLAVTINSVEPGERGREFGRLKSAPPSADDPIPSIVHYVYIKKDVESVIQFPFASFLTLFASVMYIKPTQIYIHTDFNETEIRNASLSGDRWTRAVINTFPDILRWNEVSVPNFAGPNENQRINTIQHKSDFIRWDTIAKIGGIYLDWDVVPLRPLTPLLNAGFAFVGGRQYGGANEDGSVNGTINNGAFLTKPNSTMARIIVREQHAGFNGAWASNLHSMTIVAEHLVTIPNEVLILDRNSFAPTHWFPDSALGTDALFKPNPGHPSPKPLFTNTTNPMELYENLVLNRRRRAEWEMDFSATYLLHGFSMSHYLDFINPKTILSRTSNLGVATYDVVKKMKSDGLISGNEDGKEPLEFPDELNKDDTLSPTSSSQDNATEDVHHVENKDIAT